MEKPSVTIKHREAYFLGGMILVFSLIAIIPNVSSPPEDQLFGWILIGCQVVLGLIVMGFGDSMEIIDENGIYMKGFAKARRYAWSDFIEVGVAKVRGRKAVATYHPEIYLTVRGGALRRTSGEMWQLRNFTTGITLEYRKKIWECILYHYGAPDFDEWGKPPEIT